MKTILTPEQIEEIQLQRNITPIKDIASKFHIGYSRIYQIWRQIDPDSIRPKKSQISNIEQQKKKTTRATKKTKNKKQEEQQKINKRKHYNCKENYKD